MDTLQRGATSLDPNFAVLGNNDEYAQYFNQLATVFRHLMSCYRLMEETKNQEAEIIRHYLSRLLYTVKTLRLKYLFTARERPLWVDLTESGFPNFAEISALQAESQGMPALLADLPAASLLKRLLLDHIFQNKEEPAELLGQLGKRLYLERLAPALNLLFLPFCPGGLLNSAITEGGGKLFSWGCYDCSTNRAYLHLMLFDQDERVALDESSPAREEFLRVISTEGARAPDVGILAMAIDDALPATHPKILKRLCVGPLYSRLLLDGRSPNPEDAREAAIREAFRRHGSSPLDYILFFTDEIVFSKRQEISRGLLAPLGKVREIFAIGETDPECLKRRASVIRKRVLLPHLLLQHLAPEMQSRIPDFQGARKFTFDEQGTVHGV